MSMKWAVPTATMEQTYNKRTRKDSRQENRERNNRLKCCPDCNCVFKKASFVHRQFREGMEEEYYESGTMPTYGLDRKQCLICKGKSATTI